MDKDEQGLTFYENQPNCKRTNKYVKGENLTECVRGQRT